MKRILKRVFTCIFVSACTVGAIAMLLLSVAIPAFGIHSIEYFVKPESEDAPFPSESEMREGLQNYLTQYLIEKDKAVLYQGSVKRDGNTLGSWAVLIDRRILRSDDE